MRLKREPKPKVRKADPRIPQHVAIIMDGNGRWAMQQGLQRLEGHRAGVDNIRPVLECLSESGVKYVTIYAFSTENWNRPVEEVEGLMIILQEIIHKETLALHERDVRILHLGRMDRFSPELKEAVTYAKELTKDNEAITLSVAFHYGGRMEILEAVKRIMEDGIQPEQLDEALFSRYLYTADLPDPDLIIRTGGELRLSNFLPWQSAYSEYYTTSTLWPDFGEVDIGRAMESFSQRQRRFGILQPEDSDSPA